MLVANSFDLWQKDTFFSAAEEVQQSADIMESAYRRWAREKQAGVAAEYVDELCRELQMALGTAKWQLEEFERAVRLSHRNCRDEITMTRHKQFVSVIEEQISCVEASLRESFFNEGKQPLRWVNLDEDDLDDLAHFLSGHTSTSQKIENESDKIGTSVAASLKGRGNTRMDFYKNDKVGSDVAVLCEASSSEDHNSSITNANCAVKEDVNEIPGTRDSINGQSDRIGRTRRIWSSPDIRRLEIVVDSGYEENSPVMLGTEPTPKDKGVKNVFWRSRWEAYPFRAGHVLLTRFRKLSWRNQVSGGSPRLLLNRLTLPFHCSTRFLLVLMITILLVGAVLV